MPPCPAGGGAPAPGPGCLPSPRPLRTLSVRLSAEDIARLKELGEGNASAGVRRLLTKLSR